MGSNNVISSLDSAVGHVPLDLPTGLMTENAGQEVAPVSLLVSLEDSAVRRTNAICGLSSEGSSKHETLQSSLENRLRQRLVGSGSPMYALTWKRWNMKSGEPICALRASALRSHGKDSSSWPNPAARDWKDLNKKEKAYHSQLSRHAPNTVTRAYLRGFVSSQIPELLCRLMGYPVQWVKSAPSATR